MVEFKTRDVVTKRYIISVDEFMNSHFKSAQKHEGDLDVYNTSVLLGCRVRVFSVKLLPEELDLDFSDHANIRRVLLRKFAD